ncbi:Adipocyte plasma membrane-associated protein [Morus notabilis]|uniref:Adipocyte plasma membrane-associated protein n=1 Tax=Morus notabilis TaxID=981085 RepID=W9T0J8_9ROSA|nr:protein STRICTOSIDINE SYNTHASE-LIKE 4 [Morus notabilis]EXC35260.1 Adipocyte plasma membrane-associated protein [Morus notabilis]
MADKKTETKTSWPFSTFLLFSAIFSVVLALLVYQLEPFEPVPLPVHELIGAVARAPASNDRLLRGSELVGVGALVAAEDVAYDAQSGVIYTGCVDGWVKRVRLNDSGVDSWINTGGRPLGLAVDHANHKLLVADAEKGLLSISEDGVIEVLSDEAEGLKFKLTDGVDIAKDGTIYFTDASHKYHLKDFIWDILEGKPHGRLLSYDPSTKQTKVLVRGLYFANGVAVSPDQSSVIFCETVMRRCRKYHLKGERKGSVDPFIERLPGMPDNIRYDGEGLYWIALSTEATWSWNLAQKFPFIRKAIAIIVRHIGRPHMEKNGGVFAVDLEGKPVFHYYDPALSLISSGAKIGNHLYCGSIAYPYIIRLNLQDYPARPTT